MKYNLQPSIASSIVLLLSSLLLSASAGSSKSKKSKVSARICKNETISGGTIDSDLIISEYSSCVLTNTDVFGSIEMSDYSNVQVLNNGVVSGDIVVDDVVGVKQIFIGYGPNVGGVTVEKSTVQEIYISEATVTGNVVSKDSVFSNAIQMFDGTVNGDVTFKDSDIPYLLFSGDQNLIKGDLTFDKVKLDEGNRFFLGYAEIEGDMTIKDTDMQEFAAVQTHILGDLTIEKNTDITEGGISLSEIQVDGDFTINNSDISKFEMSKGHVAEDLKIEGLIADSLLISEESSIGLDLIIKRNSLIRGDVELSDSTIGGRLKVKDVTIEGNFESNLLVEGSVLEVEDCIFEGDLLLNAIDVPNGDIDIIDNKFPNGELLLIANSANNVMVYGNRITQGDLEMAISTVNEDMIVEKNSVDDGHLVIDSTTVSDTLKVQRNKVAEDIVLDDTSANEVITKDNEANDIVNI